MMLNKKDELTVNVSTLLLSCKAIVDLVDELSEEFYYVPSEQIGYAVFKDMEDVYEFCDRITEIKDSLISIMGMYDKSKDE